MTYPGLTSKAKSYLWKTVGIPSIKYGMNCIKLSKHNIQELESTQGSIIKHVMGLSKRHRHSRLLRALDIPKVSTCIENDFLSLVSRISSTPSVVRSVFFHLLAKYLYEGIIYKGTSVDVFCEGGYPLYAVFDSAHYIVSHSYECDGVVDSLKYLVEHPRYRTRGSYEHTLAGLLTRSF